MEMIPVSSSNLRAVGYDATNLILDIEFNDMSLYRYINIPISVYKGLINANSLGKYFNENIRNRKPYSPIRLK